MGVTEEKAEASQHGRMDAIHAAILLIQDLSYLVEKEHEKILGVPGGIEAFVTALVEAPARALLGKCVSIHGLVSRPELNDEQGVMQSILGKGRVAVQLHG